jgi:hypothetical protein
LKQEVSLDVFNAFAFLEDFAGDGIDVSEEEIRGGEAEVFVDDPDVGDERGSAWGDEVGEQGASGALGETAKDESGRHVCQGANRARARHRRGDGRRCEGESGGNGTRNGLVKKHGRTFRAIKKPEAKGQVTTQFDIRHATRHAF